MATKKQEPRSLARLLPFVVTAAVASFITWATTRPGFGPVQPNPAAATAAPGKLDPASSRPDQYDWTHLPDPSFPIPPYAKFLQDVAIVVDPGHVGQSEKNRPSGWKRGPTGLREAEANLRVARYLRDFLETSGATVIMTREQDVPLDISDEEDLADRAAIANKARGDLLVSIHHNAADKPEPNYTAVFYHADGAGSPASLDAARNLLTGINDALRLEKHGDCGLWSDLTMYPNGFGLLRRLEIPGVLCESSFHTNPDEERRLRDPVYNRREAYGMFLGLARWAQSGLPRVELVD
jgi:N-acetylmuramoyl-L-alanine amidase